MDKVTLTKEECHIVSHVLELEILRLEHYGDKHKDRQAFEGAYRKHINALKEINEKVKQR